MSQIQWSYPKIVPQKPNAVIWQNVHCMRIVLRISCPHRKITAKFKVRSFLRGLLNVVSCFGGLAKRGCWTPWTSPWAPHRTRSRIPRSRSDRAQPILLHPDGITRPVRDLLSIACKTRVWSPDARRVSSCWLYESTPRSYLPRLFERDLLQFTHQVWYWPI